MKKHTLFLVLLSLCSVFTAQAQLPHSWECGFEDVNENSQWVLNYCANPNYTFTSKWYIGNAVSSLGSNALYISADGGKSAQYTREVGNASRLVVAYRELQLEAGDYDIAFDWMMAGDSTRAALYVAWVPESDFGEINSLYNDNISATKWSKYCCTFNGYKHLTGASVWSHAVDHITSDGTPHRLVVAFVLSGTAAVINPAASLDNIQIARNNCGRPTNLKSTTVGQMATLSWQSTGDRFRVKMQRLGDSNATILSTSNKSLTEMLEHGVYNVQMQVVCQGDTSVWYDFPVIFIFDARCFNYLDLTDDRCYYSESTNSDYTKNETKDLKQGRIDYGFASMYSRHTIHYSPNEYDARTYNSVDMYGKPVSPLKVVPEGELAVVRLGSWEQYARVARIEYDFTVDAQEAGALMLKYAMILESSGHDEAGRPRLMIDIVDAKTNKPISECTTIDLASQTSGPGWYRVPDGGDGSRDICWRDWETLGINLGDEYHGREIKVVITALGCSATIHGGYAYFTINCTSGHLEGIQCGNTPTHEFIAPEGFNYRWYKKYPTIAEGNKVLSTERIYPVDYQDTTTYQVEVINKSKPGCSFTLTANATPRFPIPEASYEIIQRDCKNYIKITNNSHIRTKIWSTGEEIDTDVRPEAIRWDFLGLMPDSLAADGMPWEPEFELPSQEANYTFTLQTIVGLCDSIQVIDVYVPQVGPQTVVETKQLCSGEVFQYQGKFILEDTTIVNTGINIAGCDSTHLMVVRFVDVIRDTIYATIPEGETYQVGNNQYDRSGTYTDQFTSIAGCDSVVILYLKVVEPLVVKLTGMSEVCPEDGSFEIYTHTEKGLPNYYEISFAEQEQEYGLVNQHGKMVGGDEIIKITIPKPMRSGRYPFVMMFDSEENGTYQVNDVLVVQYSSSLIQQRWNDVLGILNEDYNGGFYFIEFQWYRNGQPIDGETSAWYYAENQLQEGDEYSVLITEESGEQLMTCTYVVPAQPAAVQSSYSRGRKIIRNSHLYIELNGKLYNAQGLLIETDNE